MSNRVTLAVVTTTQKATFHRTRNKCKREYVLLEVALHDIRDSQDPIWTSQIWEYESCATQNGSST